MATAVASDVWKRVVWIKNWHFPRYFLSELNALRSHSLIGPWEMWIKFFTNRIVISDIHSWTYAPPVALQFPRIKAVCIHRGLNWLIHPSYCWTFYVVLTDPSSLFVGLGHKIVHNKIKNGIFLACRGPICSIKFGSQNEAHNYRTTT